MERSAEKRATVGQSRWLLWHANGTCFESYQEGHIGSMHVPQRLVQNVADDCSRQQARTEDVARTRVMRLQLGSFSQCPHTGFHSLAEWVLGLAPKSGTRAVGSVWLDLRRQRREAVA